MEKKYLCVIDKVNFREEAKHGKAIPMCHRQDKKLSNYNHQ